MAKSKRDKGTAEHSTQTTSGMTSYEPNERLCLGIIALFVGFFFYKILLGDAYFWEDFLYQNYPFRFFAATTMAGGEIPLWNPYIFNGMPFLADIQTAVFYLPLTLLTLFVRNGALNFYWLELVIILHYVFAGFSMFYLARSFELRRLPSLIAAVSFSLSGFMVVHAIHQQIITVIAWYPLVLLLLKKVLEMSEWKWVFLTALALAVSFLAGFPQLSLYLYFLLFCYFVFELLTTHKMGNLLSRPVFLKSARAATAILLSFALVMIQLLPTLELADLSQRAQITYEKSVEGSLAWSQLLTLYIPKLFGSSGAEGYAYFGPGPYWHYWETCIYLGLIPLILVVLSASFLRKNRYVLFFWGVMILSLLYGLGENSVLHKFFFEFIPVFSRFRNPARIGILLTFAASLLAGMSLQRILYAEKNHNEQLLRRNVFFVLLAIGVLVWIASASGEVARILQLPADPQVTSIMRKEANNSALLLLVSAGVVWLFLRRRIYPWIMMGVLVTVMFLDILNFGVLQNNGIVNPSEYFKRSSQMVKRLKEESTHEFFRINTRNAQGMVMDRNQGMMDRIFTMEGYTPLMLKRFSPPLSSDEKIYDLLNVKYRTVTLENPPRLAFVPTEKYAPRAFIVYDIHVAKSEQELLDYIRSPSFDHRVTAALEKQPLFSIVPPSLTPTWKATVVAYRNNSVTLEVETSHDGFLVLSEVYYPGWRAYVDNQATEVYRTDYNLRGLFVPIGRHTVNLVFEPASYEQGKLITIASLFLCVIGIAAPRLRFKKQTLSNGKPQ
ncbi:MAG: YfhO family protein [Ignavibacteriales bacterium]|nr:YfhO family protein [Ignavibacteriales bacterium]